MAFHLYGSFHESSNFLFARMSLDTENRCTEKREEKLQTSVPCLCCCFLVEYLALAGLMNFLAQLSDKIHHFTVYNLMPLAFLTKLSKMH